MKRFIMGAATLFWLVMGAMAVGDPKGQAVAWLFFLIGAFGAWTTYHGGLMQAFASIGRSVERGAIQAEISAMRRDIEPKGSKNSDKVDVPVMERLAKIDAFFANELNPVKGAVAEAIPDLLSRKSIERGVVEAANKVATSTRHIQSGQSTVGDALKEMASDRNIAVTSVGIEGARFTRTLRDMTEAERASLRLAEMLRAVGIFTGEDDVKVRLPILWNDGNCALELPTSIKTADRQAAVREGLRTIMMGAFGNATAAAEHVQAGLRQALKPEKLPEDVRSALERYVVRGARWMTPTEGKTALVSGAPSPAAIRLGRFVGSTDDLFYDRNMSLATIGPPGSGKSQAHVLRNLLTMAAPAVVLDIKGEMYDHTSHWRHAHVGETYLFAPSQPSYSLHYNPLDQVRSDPMTAWDDARKLADLLVLPPDAKSAGGDSYWEDRARDIIAAAIMDVAVSEPTENRNMASVLDRLFISENDAVIAWCDHLKTLGTQLKRQGKALRGMPEKQRESVFDTARRHLNVWQSPALEILSDRSDFQPELLRQQNATLYLRVSMEEMKTFAPVLRVIIGQTVHGLCREAPETGALPVTFLLDEMPRLRRMDVIEEGLDVGRGYGVRFWLFAQNLGQLETAYPNAKGMLSNCAVRCFMNPDETGAKWLADNLGQREGLIDGKRKPLVEPYQLTGPEFANNVVAFIQGQPPARLEKTFAYADPDLRAKMDFRVPAEEAVEA